MHFPKTNPTHLATILLSIALTASITACDTGPQQEVSAPVVIPVSMQATGRIISKHLPEVSGIQASRSNPGHFYVHNDKGKSLVHVINQEGSHLGSVNIKKAKNRDWEDITSVEVEDSVWLVIGDVGDNSAKHKDVTLYFTKEPQPGVDGHYSGSQKLHHKIELTYPDGARDCESIAYDPVEQEILFLTKRDKPGRLYSIPLQVAMTEKKAELSFVGEMAELRKPTLDDRVKWGGRAQWISQPTGMDIALNGQEAAVITYRSLYRYHRLEGESWLSALQRKPEEVVGPPAKQNEAVAYTVDGKAIYVTSEILPAPVYRFEFTD